MDPVQISGALAVLAAGVAGAVYLVRGLWRGTKTLHRLADGLLGDKAAGKPSVLDQVVAIKAEMHPNGGGSLRDVLDATKAAVVRVESRLDEHLVEHRNQRV